MSKISAVEQNATLAGAYCFPSLFILISILGHINYMKMQIYDTMFYLFAEKVLINISMPIFDYFSQYWSHESKTLYSFKLSTQCFNNLLKKISYIIIIFIALLSFALLSRPHLFKLSKQCLKYLSKMLIIVEIHETQCSSKILSH